jgi:hypothetical protein
MPQPGAWGFDTPAGWPLFLITVLSLACIVAGDRAREMLPGQARAIGRLTAIVAPLAVGGGLVAVALLYQTLPWGCGSGPLVLGLGGCVMIAGAIVALFYPTERPEPERTA